MGKQLKKIYDCLNIGSNKKAVQEIDRFPKHVRDSTVFKALKSLALIRMSKRRQALEILSEINPEDNLDEVTLQTMTSAYKELVECEKILELYEMAAKRKPNDLDTMTHLFMSYVRVFDFKRQKEIAMLMRTNFPNKARLYLSWAIMSLVMQAQNEIGQPSANLCLSLAETMFERTIDGKRTNEEIELYLTILGKQKKHQKEYEYLTEPSSLRFTDHLSWFNRRRAFLCLDLKMYSTAFKHYFPALIRDYPDQLEYYQGLFDSAFALDTESTSQSVSSSNDQPPHTSPSGQNQTNGTPVKSTAALAECFEIVERQCWLKSEFGDISKDQNKSKGQPTAKNRSQPNSGDTGNSRPSLRGPFIARAELYHRLVSNEHLLPRNIFNLCQSQFATKFSNLNSLLLDYFKNFSRKIICFYDMDYMINHFNLNEEERLYLLKSIKEWVEGPLDGRTDVGNTDTFHIRLNYHMLEHFLRKYHISDQQEDRLKKAKDYIDLYDMNRHLAKNATTTEVHPADPYCLLAINSIMTNSVPSSDLNDQSLLSDSIILSLIVMAENAVSNCPADHQLKLTLLKLYSFIGASKKCSDVLVSLNIKHFQIDTLGHLLNPVLYNTGNYSLSKESLDTCTEFYSHNVRECFEGLTTSYRDGKFSKIEEISAVLRRLNDSLNASQCCLLKGIVANLNSCNMEDLSNASQSFDPYKGLYKMFRCHDSPSTIRDNRDFKVMRSLNDETNKLVKKRQLETLQDEKLWLKFRYFIIRATYLQYDLFVETNSAQAKQTLLQELNFALESIFKLKADLLELSKVAPDERYSYFEPESSSFRWKYVEIEQLTSLVSPLLAVVEASSFKPQLVEDYTQTLDAIVTKLENQLAAIDSLVSMKEALLSLTISLEFISAAATSLFSINQMVSKGTNSGPQSSSSSHGKSTGLNQQQQQITSQSKIKSTPNQLINKTEARLTKLAGIIKNVDPKSAVLDKITQFESSLFSNVGQEAVENKYGLVIKPILDRETENALSSVKEKILDSYNESLSEIEALCKRKIKLFKL